MIVSIPDHCLSIYFDCVCPCSSVVLTLLRMPFFSIKVANKNSGFLKFYVRSKQVNFFTFFLSQTRSMSVLDFAPNDSGL